MDEYLEIQKLAKQGMSKTEIARRLGLDRHTVAMSTSDNRPSIEPCSQAGGAGIGTTISVI